MAGLRLLRGSTKAANNGFDLKPGVLIGDEPEAGLENLLEVTIPEQLQEHLRDMDRLEQQQEEEEEWRRKEQEGTGTDR